MKRTLLSLVLTLSMVLLAPAVNGALYVFRVLNWNAPAIGFLDSEVGRGKGLGALFLGGYRFPLTSFDWW